MKNCITTVLLIAVCITYAQKKTNGTIYVEHPAITTVEAMTQASVSGDTDKVANYLADDFKYYSGTSTNKDDKGMNKTEYLKTVKMWKDNIDYLSIKRFKEAYPDALEYIKMINKKTWFGYKPGKKLKVLRKKQELKLTDLYTVYLP